MNDKVLSTHPPGITTPLRNEVWDITDDMSGMLWRILDMRIDQAVYDACHTIR